MLKTRKHLLHSGLAATRASRVTARTRPLRNRRLVVVDIENLVGGAVTCARQARTACELFDFTRVSEPGDHVVIGASHFSILHSGLGWPNTRLVVGSGVDGADRALLEVLTEERVESRFDEVVIASGDGIFAEIATDLAEAGVRVTVVAPPGSCANRLRMAAHDTVHLGTWTSMSGEAA